MKTLFLVDTMALAFRSFYALMRSSMSNSDGLPTSAIFGSAMFIQKLITESQPDYLAFASDTSAPTFRKEIYPEYKANRKEMPEELQQQIPHLYELIRGYGLPLLKIEGVEADDIIGTLARRLAGPDLEVTIVSGDKDFFQLVNDHVRCLITKKGNVNEVLDPEGVKAKFGVYPHQVIDMLAMMGDASDNVPGVAGIGNKGAQTLIEKYDSLEGIYANLDAITNKRQHNGLKDNREMALLSQKLVTIATDIDVPFTLADAEVKPSTTANRELQAFFAAMEFRRLTALVESGLEQQGEAAAGPGATEPQLKAATVVSLQDWLAGDHPAAPLVCQPLFVSSSADHRLLGLVTQWQGRDCEFVVWPAAALGKEPSSAAQADALLAALHSSPEVIIHDLKRLLKFLAWQGADLRQPEGHQPFCDLGIGDYLLDPNSNKHDLNRIFGLYLGDQADLPGSLAAEAAKQGGEGLLPTEWPDEWLAKLPLLSRQLTAVAEIIRAQLAEQSLERVAEDLEIPLTYVLAEMEAEGIFLDAQFLTDYSGELASKIAEAEKEIYELAGEHFNINSPKQLQAILYEKMDIPGKLGVKRIKKTKTGFSTDESQLTLLKEHPLPRSILDYRGLYKLKNTYVDPLPQQVDSVTGRLHTHFNQVMAATGRLSSDNPNLQNIPMRTPLGRHIRKAFKSNKPGWQILSADYSQVEIRLLAELSGEDTLASAFADGLDIHASTAQKVFKVATLAEVTSEQRSRAKAINFGILYGMGARRLANETDVTVKEAKAFIERYFEAFPKIKGYTEELVDRARRLGYAETMLGRRRPILGLNDSNSMIQSRAQNMAINTPIQGSAADLIKTAMIKLAQKLRDDKFETLMLLQVHDELVFSAPPAEVDAVTAVIREQMETALTTAVPMKVDIGVGADWLAAH